MFAKIGFAIPVILSYMPHFRSDPEIFGPVLDDIPAGGVSL
ncbi:hypothetical protein [uncultured Tateyamaria sp.]|nr:hypothetical protein [uncultured Tateyamaria sp.]